MTERRAEEATGWLALFVPSGLSNITAQAPLCVCQPPFPPIWPLQVAEWDSFSHHFPHLLFDSLLRILGPQVDTCVMKALRNSQCVVSRGCTVALRPAGDTRCLTCADDSTCTGVLHRRLHLCLHWS
jgi:hypothetical protein